MSEQFPWKETNEPGHPYISVFTATFNRKNTLKRVYESLKNQTYSNFEWIIVDDGSADGTGEMVEAWKKENLFPIVYTWKPNEGKHFTYNIAANLAKGKLFTSIDSDDELFPFSLERFKFYWENLNSDIQSSIIGIYFPGLDQHGNLVGTNFPNNMEVDDLVKILWKNRIKGDKGAFWVTERFRMYPFPENFKNIVVPEGSFIHRMSRDWKVCVIQEPLFRIWVNEPNRNDHLSNLSVLPTSFPGHLYYFETTINASIRHFLIWPKLILGMSYRYSRLSFILNKSIWEQQKKLKPFSSKVLWLLLLPFAYVSASMYKRSVRASK